MRRLAVILSLIAAFVLFGRSAEAHPHVWVTSQSELVYGADGAITGIRHTWKFDDMFSAYALQDIQNKEKGVYTREELAPLAQINVDSLKEFGFFTFAKAGGKAKEQFLDPTDYFLEYKDSALVLHFTLPFKQPVKTKELALEIYDPTYFVGFDLAANDPIKLVGAPASCKTAVQRPDSKGAQAPISEQSFMDGANANYGAMFSNKIKVDCP